jgi:hypothetical protein
MANDNRLSIARSTKTAFHDGDPNPEATFGDLVDTMFANGAAHSASGIANHVKFCALDDLMMISVVADSGDYGDVCARLAQRAEWWLRISDELERRMNEAAGLESPPDESFVIIPLPSAEVPIAEQLGRGRIAQAEDFHRHGWHRNTVEL